MILDKRENAMSRLARKQLLSMTNALSRADKALKVSLPKAVLQQKSVVQLLDDCQNCAVAIGRIWKKCTEGNRDSRRIRILL